VVSAVLHAVEAPSLEQLGEAQLQDQTLGLLIQCLKSGDGPTSNRLGRKVASMMHTSVLRDGMVYRRFETPEGAESYCVIVPKAWQRRIVAAFHDSLAGGHLGAAKTLEKVRQVYTWMGMSKDVAGYVRACHQCQLHKSETPLRVAL
jgi:hypothetical protein